MGIRKRLWPRTTLWPRQRPLPGICVVFWGGLERGDFQGASPGAGARPPTREVPFFFFLFGSIQQNAKVPQPGVKPWPLWWKPAAAAAKSLQSCPTLCNSIDGNPRGSPVPWIPQASHQGCQVLFRTSRWNVGLLLRCCSGKVPHIAMMGQSLGFSPVTAGFSSYVKTGTAAVPTCDGLHVCVCLKFAGPSQKR